MKLLLLLKLQISYMMMGIGVTLGFVYFSGKFRV